MEEHILKEDIFVKFFQIAEIAKLKETEYQEYEASLNTYRDIKNSIHQPASRRSQLLVRSVSTFFYHE